MRPNLISPLKHTLEWGVCSRLFRPAGSFPGNSSTQVLGNLKDVMKADALTLLAVANVTNSLRIQGGFMKLATFVMVGAVLLASAICLNAQAPPAGGSQVVIGFTGGSTWTSYTTGTCVWYFPVLGDLDLTSLFVTDALGAPIIDKEHSYLIWVSKWSIQAMFNNPGISNPPFPGMLNVTLSLAVVPAGNGVVYFNSNPTSRDWTDPGNPGNLGVPVATFGRGAGLFQSADGWTSDKFYFSAPLLTSRTFILNGKAFNFRNLIPNGMTCFEYGQAASTSEAGSCTSLGPSTLVVR
jgi:hypothetical protein